MRGVENGARGPLITDVSRRGIVYPYLMCARRHAKQETPRARARTRRFACRGSKLRQAHYTGDGPLDSFVRQVRSRQGHPRGTGARRVQHRGRRPGSDGREAADPGSVATLTPTSSSPEYNHSLPGGSEERDRYLSTEWNDKAAGIVSYGAAGGVRAGEHLRQVLAQVKVVAVRSHVALSVFDDFVAEGRWTSAHCDGSAV